MRSAAQQKAAADRGIDCKLRIKHFRFIGETKSGRREGNRIVGEDRSTTARKFVSGGIMPSKGRIPPFLVIFVLAFAFVGLVGFQIVKERRIAINNIREKEFQLDNVFLDLKEQVKFVQEREKERDSAQAKLLELERASQSAQDDLHTKDSELAKMDAELATTRLQYDRIADELSQAKKIVKQRDEEIVHIREQLQEFSFEKAKESAEQIKNNAVESTLDNRQAEEHKPADEAGLDDRKKLQDLEEATKDGDVSATEKEMDERAAKDVDVSATEKEMDERSKPKDDVLNEGESTTLGAAKEQEMVDNIDEFSKLGGLQGGKSEEQDNEDTRDLDEKESQEEDLHELTKLESDLQTGNHEDADAQEADHSIA